MSNSVLIVAAAVKNLDAIISLLQTEKLPAIDLPADLQHFFVAKDNEFIVGAAGLEVYHSYGLLRSLVVKKEYREMKVAGQLVKAIEMAATERGLQAIYLLTETAPGFFANKSYEITDRTKVPDPLLKSSEFSHVCPQTAIVMKKNLR